MGNAALGGRGAATMNGPRSGGAGQGGAIFNHNTLSLVACTLAANSAVGGLAGEFSHSFSSSGAGGVAWGGAIYNAAPATLSLNNCTITANSAEGPDGLHTQLNSTGAPAYGGGVANLGRSLHVGEHATGVGLFEVYDLDQTAESKLANVSTRGFLGNGDDVMIVGAIVVGSAPRVLFRAVGPTLTDVGVPNALGDPLLQLYDGNGGLVAANYDWRDDQEAEIIATGIPPSNDLESAIVRDLVPGPYTAIMRDTHDTPGNGRIEAYTLN